MNILFQYFILLKQGRLKSSSFLNRYPRFLDAWNPMEIRFMNTVFFYVYLRKFPPNWGQISSTALIVLAIFEIKSV